MTEELTQIPDTPEVALENSPGFSNEQYLKDRIQDLENLLQMCEHENDVLRKDAERNQSLIENAPTTIRQLQDANDKWRDAVSDLCRIANPTVNQIIEAGFEVEVVVREGE